MDQMDQVSITLPDELSSINEETVGYLMIFSKKNASFLTLNDLSKQIISSKPLKKIWNSYLKKATYEAKVHVDTLFANDELEARTTQTKSKMRYDHYIRFIKYVIAVPSLKQTEKGFFSSEKNTQSFFKNIIAKVTQQKNSCTRYIPHLQFFIDNYENSTMVISKLPQVISALRDSDVLRNVQTEESVDAFDHDPTRLCSLKEEKRLIFETYTTCTHDQWEDFVLALLFQTYTYSRGNEYRAIRIPFFRVDTSDMYCPYPEGPMAYTLINLRNPYSTKTNSSMKTVVGGWRHRDFYRCYHAIIAFKVCRMLQAKSAIEINEYFLLQERHYYEVKGIKDHSKPPFYHDYLSIWDNRTILNGDDKKAARGMRKEFEIQQALFEIKRFHNSYFRAEGMVRSMNLGSPKENITLLSGHTAHKDKADISYFSALNKNVSHTNAGFEVCEEYFLPRVVGTYQKICARFNASIDKNTGEDNLYNKWTHLLFPCIKKFESIFVDPPVDRILYPGASGREFWKITLPYYAKVIIEDGVMWVNEFPNHHYTYMLVHVLGDQYESFSKECYQLITKYQENYDASTFSKNSVKAYLSHGDMPTTYKKSGCFNQSLSSEKQMYDNMNTNFPMRCSKAINENVKPDVVENNFCTRSNVYTRDTVQTNKRVCSFAKTSHVTIPTSLPKSIFDIMKHHVENKLYECTGKSNEYGWTTSQQKQWRTRQNIFEIIVDQCNIEYDHTNGENLSKTTSEMLLNHAKKLDKENYSKGKCTFTAYMFSRKFQIRKRKPRGVHSPIQPEIAKKN